MTAVLLIADSERVQRVFADLESKGVLQLHAAATLDQADQELTAILPAFTFVQSRISGLSTGILLRHLKKRLREEGKIIFLCGAADLQPGHPMALPPVDLRVTDDVLAEIVTEIVTGTAPPSPAKRGKAAVTGEGEEKKRPRQEKDARRQRSSGEQADVQEQADATQRGNGVRRPQVKAKKPQSRAPLSQGARQAAVSQEAKQASLSQETVPADSLLRTIGTEAAAGILAEVICAKRPAVPAEPPEESQPEQTSAMKPDQTEPERSLVDAEPPEQSRPERSPATVEPPPGRAPRHTEAAFSGLPQPAALFPVQDEQLPAAREAVTAAPPAELAPAEGPAVTGAPAQSFMELVQTASARRGVVVSSPPSPTEEPDETVPPLPAKGKKPLWLFLLLLAFLLIPSAAYLLGRIAAAPEQEARLGRDAVAGERGAFFAAATSAADRALSRASTATPREGAQPLEAAHPSGLATLPPFLQDLEVDRGYGDRHPGWERYLGAKAEYKLFREAGRYRAIQAIARGDEIPDQLIRRVLLEFGASAGYAVTSTEQKGGYLVEQATTSGSAALTIYRKINDPRVRGLVVYYR